MTSGERRRDAAKNRKSGHTTRGSPARGSPRAGKSLAGDRRLQHDRPYKIRFSFSNMHVRRHANEEDVEDSAHMPSDVQGPITRGI